jgi:cyclophilin family peptidyl-prolyl cis-trans isomerase
VLHKEMIQSGDPTGTGVHNCGFTIPDEFLVGIQFNKAGMLAVANTGEPNSGACQFFITTDIMHEWNGKYTIFGEVIGGMPVVDEIASMPLKGDKPINPVKLISVRVVRIGVPPRPKGKKK